MLSIVSPATTSEAVRQAVERAMNRTPGTPMHNECRFYRTPEDDRPSIVQLRERIVDEVIRAVGGR